jgi:hypothetical protein
MAANQQQITISQDEYLKIITPKPYIMDWGSLSVILGIIVILISLGVSVSKITTHFNKISSRMDKNDEDNKEIMTKLDNAKCKFEETLHNQQNNIENIDKKITHLETSLNLRITNLEQWLARKLGWLLGHPRKIRDKDDKF